jgi:hypothetical protein
VSILLLVAGVAVIAVVLHDAYVTTVSAHGAGGPITSVLGDGLWGLARRVARSPHSRVP